MDADNFNGEAGRLLRRWATFGRESIEFDYFMPNELPDMKSFCNDLSLIEKSNEANRAIGELQGLTKNIGNINLFIEPYLRKEAVDSSEIEGTFVSLTDVFLSEAGSKKPEFTNPNVKEVVNFVESIEYALKKLKTNGKIDKDFINTMHKILLRNVRGRDKLIGEFRKQQNWISKKPSKTPVGADFVPPTEEKVEELMNYLLDYMNEEDGMMRLIKAGLIHYYFETIHPYEDGNGRVGRTMILLYLIKSKILEEPILYLSPYFKKYKDVYYSLLMEVRKKGNYDAWIKFFLEGIIEMAINTSEKVKRLIDLYNEYKQRLTDMGATPISYSLLDKFFERPYWFISLLQEELGGENYPKTKRGMNYLVEANIIQEFTRFKRNKIFVSPDVLKILEEELI